MLQSGPAGLLAIAGTARVLVVCTVGADLGLVPELADLIAVHDVVEVRVVLPPRGPYGYLDVALARLGLPVEIISVDPPWASQIRR